MSLDGERQRQSFAEWRPQGAARTSDADGPKAKGVPALALDCGNDVVEAVAHHVALDDALAARRRAPLQVLVIAQVEVLL